jgi:hypothetical protein
MEFLLGLLGWREKRRFMNPLSESPLGQPLVRRDDKGRELIVGLKLFLSDNTVIPSLRRRRGNMIIWSREGKEKGDERTVHCQRTGIKVRDEKSWEHRP